MLAVEGDARNAKAGVLLDFLSDVDRFLFLIILQNTGISPTVLALFFASRVK